VRRRDFSSKVSLNLPDPSKESQRGDRHAIDELSVWYCSEPTPSFSKALVMKLPIPACSARIPLRASGESLDVATLQRREDTGPLSIWPEGSPAHSDGDGSGLDERAPSISGLYLLARAKGAYFGASATQARLGKAA